MDERSARSRSPFRLNLEQQKKRAKDLLRAAKAGDPQARRRIESSGHTLGDTVSGHVAPADMRLTDIGAAGVKRAGVKLADAQRAIARELGFRSWERLRAHIVAMDHERAAMTETRTAVDADLETLHVRCGSDIRATLKAAGFDGDFLEHAYPYAQGPVTEAPDSLARRAEFLVEAFGNDLRLEYDEVLVRCRDEEQRLAASVHAYERVVLWTEHDSYDQLMLVRCLALFAGAGAPRTLELVATNHFPGDVRFLGLGQLPPEALRLLWKRRRPVTRAQLTLGADAWRALAADDPRALAVIMRTGTSELPLLAPALHRHLRELPSVEQGLSLTEQLILEMLAQRSLSMNDAFRLLRDEREPLPWLGDLGFAHIVERMLRADRPVIRREMRRGEDAADVARPSAWDAILSITELGRAVLRGEIDWLSLMPLPRWVGGVQIDRSHASSWRWDEARRDATHRAGG